VTKPECVPWHAIIHSITAGIACTLTIKHEGQDRAYRIVHATEGGVVVLSGYPNLIAQSGQDTQQDDKPTAFCFAITRPPVILKQTPLPMGSNYTGQPEPPIPFRDALNQEARAPIPPPPPRQLTVPYQFSAFTIGKGSAGRKKVIIFYPNHTFINLQQSASSLVA
jgi:hypothetical protein